MFTAKLLERVLKSKALHRVLSKLQNKFIPENTEHCSFLPVFVPWIDELLSKHAPRCLKGSVMAFALQLQSQQPAVITAVQQQATDILHSVQQQGTIQTQPLAHLAPVTLHDPQQVQQVVVAL